MTTKTRIIYSDNSTLSDFTQPLGNYHSGTESMVIEAANDKLFIGSHFPFNHLYFKVGTANTNTSAMTVKTWTNGTFDEVAELTDETLLSDASLGQSGFVSWVVDRSAGWGREDTQSESGTERVTGLGGKKIYDLYWIEISWGSDFSAGSSLSWLGHKFSDDNDLKTEFPDLLRSNTLTAFESGKTDWEAQHVLAADLVSDELIKMGAAIHENQILERDDFKLASVQAVAKVAFNAFGDDYNDNRDEAQNEFIQRMRLGIKRTIDKDNDANVDRHELDFNQGKLFRGRASGMTGGFR